MDRLKFIVPDTGQEFDAEFMDAFPVVLSAEEAVLGIGEMFTEAELLVALGEVFPIVSAVIGQWFSLGAGYAAGRAAVAKENMESGFSRGVVMGADGRKPELLKDYFWKFSPDPNAFDEEAGRIGQTAYNQGLVAGFMQGRELSKDQRSWLWKDLGHRIGDQSWRGESSTWSRNDWIDWYITVAATFRKDHLE
jgi:hypothetical protein